jgi:predicted N-acyltransferase
LNLYLREVETLKHVPAKEWNLLVPADNPFLRHEFLAGLEEHRCLDQHGWYPAHILASSGDQLVGALPLYFKTNSIGEFVFDWSWADAYERAGGNYYPKLVSAVPFTPVTGPRCLVRQGAQNRNEICKQIYARARQLAVESNVSGLHYLFPEETESGLLHDEGLLLRKACQYHWHNQNYHDFDEFLQTLNSKKRKQIRKERRHIQEANIEIEILPGDSITSGHWKAYYPFYTSTFYRKWGEPRFTLPFFESLGRNLPESVLLILAKYRNEYVAGVFAMQGTDTLYGRHWGCSSEFRFLHFELCYYQTINYCIEHGLRKLDAGVQGEHKISRGFVPVTTWSAHWIANEQFRNAIGNFLEQERQYIDDYMKELSTHLAYKSA